MSKTTAPLLSFGASGQIAKTQVYSSWKGRPYARRYVIPANPNTSAQQLTRNTFKFLVHLFQYAPAEIAASFAATALARQYTALNAFTHANLSNMRSDSDLTDLIVSAGALGGFAPASVTVSPGTGDADVTGVAVDLPTDWVIANFTAVAINDQDPQDPTDYVWVSDQDNSDPYAITLTGLDAGDYFLGGFFTYTRPDGKTAYGPSIGEIATVS